MEGNLSNIEFNYRNNVCNRDLSIIDNNISILKKEEYVIENKKIELIIRKEIKNLKRRLIGFLFDKIVISKLNNDKKYIELKIFFRFSNKFFERGIVENDVFMKKNYEFRRGYTTTSTRRYIIKYKVISYICA